MIDQYINVYNITKEAQKIDCHGIYRMVYPCEEIFEMHDETKKRLILANYVRASYGNTAHFGGQCRMGRSIKEGVVDSYLNVFGTKNLKVADLSVVPILQDGNNTMPVQVIGLNAAKFIMQEQNHRHSEHDCDHEQKKECWEEDDEQYRNEKRRFRISMGV